MSLRRGIVAMLVLLASAVTSASDPLISQREMERITRGAQMLGGVVQSFRQTHALPGVEQQRWGYGVVEQPMLDHALAQLLQQLRAAAGPEAPPARIVLTPDPSLQAFATEDGTIFIAVGMLRSLESGDELAALVAHEYVHILKRHAGRGVLQNVQGAMGGLSALYLDHEHGGSAVSSGQPTTHYLRQALMREAAMQSVQSGIVPARARAQEDEADRLGTDLMIAAGYNPVGMLDMLAKLESWEAQRAAAQAAVDAAPASPAGLGGALMRYLGNTDQARSAGRKLDDQPLIDGMLASLVGGTQRAVRQAGRSHRTSSTRIEQVMAHVERRHRDLDRPDMRALTWRGDPSVTDFLDAIDRLHAALADAPSRVGTGRDRTTPLAAGMAAGTPLGRYANLRHHASTGRWQDDPAVLQAELKRPDSLFVMHQLAMELSARSADREQALQTLETSRQSLGDPPELLPYAIRLHRRAGKTDIADAFATRCVGSGDTRLIEACRRER